MVGHAQILCEPSGWWVLIPPPGSIWARSWYETEGQAEAQAICMGWALLPQEFPLPQEQEQEEAAA